MLFHRIHRTLGSVDAFLQLAKQRFYYLIKPVMPWRVRMFLRRVLTRRILARSHDVWPINESAGRKPAGWPGWPEGKAFSFVITHDVEGAEGLAKVRQLAALEMEMGFRSTFNFIPEGSYSVQPELRAWLLENGFEVGVHDLKHDGKLYASRRGFPEKAGRINRYLRDWQASGYRSAFMLRNLDWLHELDIAYDSSTFDTDPFEPQPDGAGSIFPYWIPLPNRGGADAAPNAPKPHQRGGYVELPYTLPQDSTLFLVLEEKTPEIWLRKLDWIAAHGGMALVNVHPDYLRFENEPASPQTFTVSHYRVFLEYLRTKHAGAYWHALPRDAARVLVENRERLAQQGAAHDFTLVPPSGVKIWIDLENTPHIPFFNPIIKELEKRGHKVVLTARDAYQTCEMADLYGFKYKKIGHHYGKVMILKAWGLGVRMLQLLPYLWKEKPALALNHGARSQTILCRWLGVPNVTIMDYEHTAESGISDASWNIFPEVVFTHGTARSASEKRLGYAGIKEDVYVSELRPNPAILQQLKLTEAKIIVTVRPPANEAHYHNPEADVLFNRFMERAVATPGAKVVLLPRNKRQEAIIRAESPQWFQGTSVVIPDTVVDGMNLLWYSDLVVSGGGTMNREAAALGVPVYSIFRGTIGAVDRYLQAEGRLTMIETVADVDAKIPIVARPKNGSVDPTPRKALSDIVNHVEAIINRECRD